MTIYNVFRSKHVEELCCVVPEARVVPKFLTRPAWEYDRKLDAETAPPRGFDIAAAHAGVRFNGFYLFQAV